MLLLSDKIPLKEPGRFNEYKTSADTAFLTTCRIAFHLLRDEYPEAEITLVHFKPVGNNVSHKSYKHD